MGGNIFPSNRRVNNTEYRRTIELVKYQLSDIIAVHEIPHLLDKESHGDIDLIVTRHEINFKFIEWLRQFDCHINGKRNTLDFSVIPEKADTLSIQIDDLQVDFILSNNNDPEFSIRYHAYNDLGGILGASLHHQGFTLTPDGLYIRYRPVENHKAYPIYVSKDYDHLLDVFEIDKTIYSKGVRSIDHMIEYLKSWKYFDPDSVCLDKMSSSRKSRMRKRKVIAEVSKKLTGYEKTVDYKELTKWLDYFDRSAIEARMTEIDKEVEQHLKAATIQKKAFSLDRVVSVLGFAPPNPRKLFSGLAGALGKDCKAKAVELSDDEFKALCLSVLKEIQSEETV